MTSEGGGPLHPNYGYMRSGVLVASCFLLSHWASPFSPLSLHCARQKAPLSEPEKISANHRRAAQSQAPRQPSPN